MLKDEACNSLRFLYRLTYTLIIIFPQLLYSFFLSSAVAVLGNSLIDRLGHKTGRGLIPVRTPLTHTLPRSVLWGWVPSLILIPLNSYEVIIISLIALLNGPSHMLLDVFTERGIYVKRNGKWRRVALAHFSYDNPAVNGLAILLGILMLFAALYLHNYQYNNYYF